MYSINGFFVYFYLEVDSTTMYLAIGVAGGIVLLLVIIFVIYRMKKRQQQKININHKDVSMNDIKGSRVNENVYSDDH